MTTGNLGLGFTERPTVQTFLPDPDFHKSAASLDRQRLGKQRVEVLQLLQVEDLRTRGQKGGWLNHPAAKMWRGYGHALSRYGLSCCQEWLRRGYKDTCTQKIADLSMGLPYTDQGDPPWLGSIEFHASHKSNLVRKAPEHYGKLWPETPRDLPYVWPDV